MIRSIISRIADLFAAHRVEVATLIGPKRNTLRDDAARFVAYLIARAPATTRHCNGVFVEYSSKWPGMCNEAWRAEVLRLIAEWHSNKLTSPKFAGPCQLDSDWQFSCYSAMRAIPELSLDDPMP